jgi:hypothetical protein
VLPALKDVACVTRRSTSAGLSRADNGEACRIGRAHVYVAEKDGADSGGFCDAARPVLAGRVRMDDGQHQWRPAGTLDRRPDGGRAGAPVFEGGPVLVPPVQQDKEAAARSPLMGGARHGVGVPVAVDRRAGAAR